MPIHLTSIDSYVRTARGAHAAMRRLLAAHPEPANNKTQSASEYAATFNARTEAVQHADVAVVFAAISLEAWINGYGTEHLGADFKRLERSPVLDKWRTFPKRAGRAGLDPDREAWPRLEELFEKRNRLVHERPMVFADHDAMRAHIEAEPFRPDLDADNAIAALDAVVRELGPEARDLHGPSAPRSPR